MVPEVSVSATTRVDLVVLEHEATHVLPAEWVARDETRVSLRLINPPALGTAVGISSSDLMNWVQGEVTEVEGDVIQIAVRSEIPADRRDYSRTYGGIDLRYQVIPRQQVELISRRWMATGKSTSDTWFKPDPFMDFSASGLKFHDNERCTAGDQLLVEFRVPGSPVVHRATAHVIRVLPIPTDEMDNEPFEIGGIIPSCMIATHFLQLDAASIIALIQFSDRIREAAVF
jgi:hypothetical protein